MKEIHINIDDYKKHIIPWYQEHISLSGLSLVSSEITELNAKLGLDYLYNGFDQSTIVFKVIDEQLFFLAKIKFGI
jgi:hypothetical protein